MTIQIAFKFGAESTSERVEIFSATVFHADAHPMTTGSHVLKVYQGIALMHLMNIYDVCIPADAV